MSTLFSQTLPIEHRLLPGGGLAPGIVNWDSGIDSIGGHAVVIVGYVPNGEIPENAAAQPGYGGGYLIAKNSWGCGGDGGYMYLAYDWVIDQAKSAAAVTHVSSTLAAPEATLSIDKSVLTAPGHVNFTVHVNSNTKKLEVFRGPTPHAILNKKLSGEELRQPLPASMVSSTAVRTASTTIGRGSRTSLVIVPYRRSMRSAFKSTMQIHRFNSTQTRTPSWHLEQLYFMLRHPITSALPR